MSELRTSTDAGALVHVALPGREYDIVIEAGVSERLADLLQAHFPDARFAIVTDDNVERAHGSRLARALEEQGLLRGSFTIPHGEKSKSFGALAQLAEDLLACGLERGDLVIALGGGVIGDLAGFASSLVRRGVRLVQIPTSLLAQVNSSVGGKTAINTPQGKNLVGTFHQPSLVLIDTDLLSTLPPREMRAGYAEVAKYGLLGDARFFGWLEENWRRVFGNDPSILSRAIERCVAMKADIVVRDETETGERMLLNLGHTFGHALEAWTGYSDRLLHGEGVSIGMVLAYRLSEQLGLCPKGCAARVEEHLAAVGLPTRIAEIPPGDLPEADTLIAAMAQDKKVRQGRLTFILAHDIGKTFISRDITTDVVRAFLVEEIKRRPRARVEAK